MMKHLNEWQRIGLILSLMWFALVLVAVTIARFDSPAKEGLFIEMIAVRADPAGLERVDVIGRDGSRTSHTWNEMTGQTAILREPSLRVWPFLAAMMVPVIFGWMLAYAMVRIVRWVKAGFSIPRPGT